MGAEGQRGAQAEGFVEEEEQRDLPHWEVGWDRMWALGRCGPQLSIPHPRSAFPAVTLEV